MQGGWQITVNSDSIVAIALHDGHALRGDVAALMALRETDRLREEDPGTGVWTDIAQTRIVPRHSRFQIDLNRPREEAVYLTPDHAWGLEIWKRPPPAALIERSLHEYDAFYAEAKEILKQLVHGHGVVVVLDLHSYNHRRDGADEPPADPLDNPEVNIGTGSLDRTRFGGLADRFMADLRQYDFLGRNLDVRENVKFFGGHFSRWSHATFPDSVCTLAIEFKKFFVDEWTGVVDVEAYEEIPRALASTLPGLRDEIDKLLSHTR